MGIKELFEKVYNPTSSDFWENNRLQMKKNRRIKLIWRDEDSSFYDKVIKENRKRKLNWRGNDQKYYDKIVLKNRERKLLWRKEDEDYYSAKNIRKRKEKRKEKIKSNIRGEFFRSVPSFKLTNSVFLLILLIISFSNVTYNKEDFRFDNYTPKSTYLETFVRKSSTSGDAIFEGFFGVSNVIGKIAEDSTNIFNGVLKFFGYRDIPDSDLLHIPDGVIEEPVPWTKKVLNWFSGIGDWISDIFGNE